MGNLRRPGLQALFRFDVTEDEVECEAGSREPELCSVGSAGKLSVREKERDRLPFIRPAYATNKVPATIATMGPLRKAGFLSTLSMCSKNSTSASDVFRQITRNSGTTISASKVVVFHADRKGTRLEELIAGCARKIVELLQRSGEINILNLCENLSERSVVGYQALGWLAHEGRIHYRKLGSQVYVSLVGK
jgi:hypothetical protein